MHRILLAAAAALTIAGVPAFAQSTDCPQGTTNTAPEGSPVTCEADASAAEPAPADPAGEQQAIPRWIRPRPARALKTRLPTRAPSKQPRVRTGSPRAMCRVSSPCIRVTAGAGWRPFSRQPSLFQATTWAAASFLAPRAYSLTGLP